MQGTMVDPNIPSETTTDIGLFAFLDSIAGKALQGYKASQGNSNEYNGTDIYNNTNTPGKPSISMFGFSANELLIIGVILFLALFVFLKRM